MTLICILVYNRREFAVEHVSIKYSDFQLSNSVIISKEHWYISYYQCDSNQLRNILSLFIFLSYLSFSIFGAAGYAFKGMEFIKKYRHRPRLPKPEEHVLAKTVLREYSEAIIEQSRMVYDLNVDFKRNKNNMGVREKKNKSRIMMKTIAKIKERQNDFYEMKDIYERENEFEKENPLVNIGFLILGITYLAFGVFVTLNNFYFIQGSYAVNDTVYFYIRKYFGQVVVYILLITFYFFGITAMYKGHDSLAQMLPDWLLTSYRLEEDKTWTDSFLSIANLFLLFSFGMACMYARQHTTLFNFTGVVKIFSLGMASTLPYTRVFEGNFFNMSFILFFIIGIIITLFQKAPRERLRILVQEKKEDLKIKKEVIENNPGIV